MSAKVPLIVYAFHTTDESGGFLWAPDNEQARASFIELIDFDEHSRNYETGTLVSLSVRPYESLEECTSIFEGELQDAIEVGAVGHIIKRYTLEPSQLGTVEILDWFEVTEQDDGLGDPHLVCMKCADELCNVEHNDTLASLVSMATEHWKAADHG